MALTGGDPIGMSQRFLASQNKCPCAHQPSISMKYGIVCVILGLAIFVELRSVTDRRTDTRRQNTYTALV